LTDSTKQIVLGSSILACIEGMTGGGLVMQSIFSKDRWGAELSLHYLDFDHDRGGGLSDHRGYHVGYHDFMALVDE
jgi:hypothetical protein